MEGGSRHRRGGCDAFASERRGTNFWKRTSKWSRGITMNRTAFRLSIALEVFLVVLMTLTGFAEGRAQTCQAPADEPLQSLAPEVQVQNEDYAQARSRFHTKLIRNAPALPPGWTPPHPPEGTTEILYQSGPLYLKAWISRPVGDDNR